MLQLQSDSTHHLNQEGQSSQPAVRLTAVFTGPPRGLGFQENPGSAALKQQLSNKPVSPLEPIQAFLSCIPTCAGERLKENSGATFVRRRLIINHGSYSPIRADSTSLIESRSARTLYEDCQIALVQRAYAQTTDEAMRFYQ
jgi:hypothetical protein